MSRRNPYEVLGVPRAATVAEINKAYRMLALAHHPDRNPGNRVAVENFKEINEANYILSDPEKRQRFDRYGFAGLQSGCLPETDGLESIIDAMTDFASDFFRGERRDPQAGRDIQMEMTVSLEEAARGAKKLVTIARGEQCPECEGGGARVGSQRSACRKCGGRGTRVRPQGFFTIQQPCADCGGTGTTISDPCPTCRGRGRIEVPRILEIIVPPGVDTGLQIRCGGEGESGERGGKRGDLYCVIHVEPHSVFQREGNHLLCRVPITISEAAMGAEIKVPTLGGVIEHRLRRGINSNDLERISGLGLQNRNGSRGDLFLQVQVETPKGLTKRQEELFAELDLIERASPSPERKSFAEIIRNRVQASGSS